METSVKNALLNFIFYYADKERERIADEYIIGYDNDTVDGRVVREDVFYDEEALTDKIKDNLIRDLTKDDSLVMDAMEDFGIATSLKSLVDQASRTDGKGRLAFEYLRKLLINVVENIEEMD